MAGLKDDIKFLPGVGPKRAELLNKELKIHTFEDLLYYFPYKYIDRTKFYKIREVHAGLQYIQIRGKITEFEVAGKPRQQRLMATFADDTGTITLVWFKGQKWIRESLNLNDEYIVFGKPNLYNRSINIPHPEIEKTSAWDARLNTALQPQYSVPERVKNQFITSKTIYKLQDTLIKLVKSSIRETLPPYMVEKYRLMPLNEALLQIHFPADTASLQQAQNRLKLEELFYIQLNLLRQKHIRYHEVPGFVFSRVGDNFNSFYHNNLPFELTGAQKTVLKEIRRDLGSGRQMNRLLQGDVGSGKTLVALMSMLLALDNGFQSCIMAPTEILATQHYQTILKFLDGLDIPVSLLTGSTKKTERNKLHEGLQSGELKILIGTHALIEDAVVFKNLGLVVIDEQHRFGVAQRAKLWKKNINPPHILVMTATPIPRTLAMTLYGDLDVSVIDELPPGRIPIKTQHFHDSARLRVFGFMKKQIAEGRQIYIVYPLIRESEKMDYKDLEDGVESISRAFPPPKYAISVVHGKMKAVEKEKSMKMFVRGITHIMVATTVIEVGVDVPNASVMIIESAERFGLSQLHQLRGRVGRGSDQSFCILMTGNKLSEDGKKRLETMVRTTDGFEISEVDLQLRGPGDMEGTQQSGIPFDLKIASLGRDGKILEFARRLAEGILEEDSKLEQPKNEILVRQLKVLSKTPVYWGDIS
ncbi:MAG: ATP-dependent DNA helicase RecG [Bacteroidota bacterium]